MEEEGLTTLRQMISAKKKTTPNNIISTQYAIPNTQINKAKDKILKTGLLNDFLKNE